MQRRQVLTGAAYSVAAAALPLGIEQAAEYRARAHTTRAGRAELDAVRDMTELFVRIDERHGGQHGRAAVVQYLATDIARLGRARFGSGADQAEMLNLAAEVAYLCGWKAYDAGEHGLAQRYYLQAYQLTREAGDDLHAAFVLRILAHNGMDLRRPEHTLDLAEAALERARGKADPCTMALFEITRARALANLGRRADATAQLRAAQDRVLRGEEAAMPHYAALWGSARACVSSHTAKTLVALRDHANAERHYAAAARARPAPEYRRITALSVAAEGRMQARQGHVEQACGTWARALALLDGVRSARAADAVSGIRRTLQPLIRRGARPATELDERARQWQLAHG
jgi:tetratricopeptide (TPR) repeat protein